MPTPISVSCQSLLLPAISIAAASAQLWAVAHKRAEPIATVSKHSKELKALCFGEENALITLLEGAEQLDERPNLILNIRLSLLIAMSVDSDIGDHRMSTYTSAASLFSELKTRIDTRQARIGVIGLGYVGLPLALLYTEENFRVTGFDIDQRKVATLSSGGSYIYRIPPTEIQVARLRDFCATADFSSLTDMDAIIICVPTPLDEYREPDLSFITNTGNAIAPHLRAGQLVVLESTTYPGTTEEVLVPILERGNGGGLKAARGERLREQMSFLSPSLPNERTQEIRASRVVTSRKSLEASIPRPQNWPRRYMVQSSTELFQYPRRQSPR